MNSHSNNIPKILTVEFQVGQVYQDLHKHSLFRIEQENDDDSLLVYCLNGGWAGNYYDELDLLVITREGADNVYATCSLMFPFKDIGHGGISLQKSLSLAPIAVKTSEHLERIQAPIRDSLTHFAPGSDEMSRVLGKLRRNKTDAIESFARAVKESYFAEGIPDVIRENVYRPVYLAHYHQGLVAVEQEVVRAAWLYNKTFEAGRRSVGATR